MKLSVPIYHLKRQARRLSRQLDIPLHAALDKIARQEGYSSWSLLAAQAGAATPAARLFPLLAAGDLLVVGARPGQGKTLMSLELAVEAMKFGNRSVFFTLEYAEQDIRGRFSALGVEWARFGELFRFDCSDAINAGYIMEALESAPRGTLVVIDYLQLLDQKRVNPPLEVQVQALKAFARKCGLIMVFISQIDRSYDALVKPCPDRKDIRLPNPLDLALFDKMCFLNSGKVEFQTANSAFYS
jgi:replicative DNA helicase